MTVSRPVSGVLFPGSLRRSRSVTIHLCGPPGVSGRAGLPVSTLLLVGVAEPPGSPRTLVRSYRTVSPLPVRRPASRSPPSAVCSLWPDPTGRPVLALASTVPYGAPTFLDADRDTRSPPTPRSPGRLTVEPDATWRPMTLQRERGRAGFSPGQIEAGRTARHFLQHDHIQPFHQDGPTIIDNLQRLCGPHNRAKAQAQRPGG